MKEFYEQERKVKKTEENKRRKLRIHLINEHIRNEIHSKHAKRIQKNIEQLRRDGGGIKQESFWEFRKRIKGKKKEIKNAMKNKDGELKTGPEEIKEVYKVFYDDLFKVEVKSKDKIAKEKEMELMKERAKKQEPMELTEMEIRKTIKGLKRRKACDSEGWCNEILIEGGEEMVKSLNVLFNKILKEIEIPEEWEKVTVKSIYKNKGKRDEMKNRRGIFLTNILSKAMEKAMMIRIEKQIDLGRYQNGGRKERSPKDNWLAILAVIERNQSLKRDTIVLFADAIKCFDKLWLEGCVSDMLKDGLREREDIGAAGTVKSIEEVGKNLALMEEVKGFTFSKEKSNYMIVKGKRRAEKNKEEEVKIEVKSGRLERSHEYKYLGNFIDERGTPERQIEEIGKKIIGMIKEAKNIGQEKHLGKFSTESRLIIYERTIVPTITYNLECWKLNNKNKAELERLQARALKLLLGLPDSTPYWGIIKETGIWTVEMVITYHRLMLFHNLITSDDSRLGKVVIKSQGGNNEWGWFAETMKVATELGLERGIVQNEEDMRKIEKSKWKKNIKWLIKEKLEKTSSEKEKNMRKLRHQCDQKYIRKEYLKEMSVTEAGNTIRRRLIHANPPANCGRLPLFRMKNISRTQF